jgi:hypothetical protein
MNNRINRLLAHVPNVILSNLSMILMVAFCLVMAAKRVHANDPHPDGDDMPGGTEIPPVVEIIIWIMVVIIAGSAQ